MKRLLSWLLTVVMTFSLLGTFSVQFAFAEETDAYTPLVTAGSELYANTMVVNTGWTASQLTAGTQLSYWFRGKTYTETYDENRHFNTFAAAQTAFQSRYSDAALATNVPNYILIGEFKSTFNIKYSANLFGANAGVSPNDPDFDPATAAPTDSWGENSAWNTDNETIIAYSGTYGFMWSHTDAEQQNIVNGGSKATLNIDGVSYKQGTGTQVPNVILWFKNTGTRKVTYTANIKNTITNTRYGFTAHEDTSTSFYDINMSEVRVLSASYKFFWKYVRNVSIDRCLFTGLKTSSQSAMAMLWEPGIESLTVNDVATYNDYLSQGNGGDRSVSWKLTNSMFADNASTNANYLARFTDNCYHSAISFTFENNLFRNASTATDGVFKFGAYPNASNPTPKVVMKNNTFYDSSGDKTTLIAADSSTLMAAYDLEMTGNRIIGYASPFPAFTSAMNGFTANGSWTVDNNYFSATYSSKDDNTGKVGEWHSSTTATALPVNPVSSTWYTDYNMTNEIKELLLGDPAFSGSVAGYSVNHTSKTVTASVKNGVDITNLAFSAQPDGATATVYSDAACTTQITSLTSAQMSAAGGTKTLYIVVSDGSRSVTYTFTLTMRSVKSILSWTDPKGLIKDGFGVLVPSTASGTYVTFTWQGDFYEAELGVDAFTSVSAAIAAGKTQLIMPVYTYTSIDITGGIELYGNKYGQNPNTVPADKTKDWTLSSAWSADKTVVSGNVTVTAAANPTTDAGTKIVVNGVELCGYFYDNVRAVNPYATDITLSNILFSFNAAASSSHHVIDLETVHARTDSDAVLNLDSFTVENSRFAFTTLNANTRIMDEDSPKTVIVRDNYFASGFARIGWFKQRASVKNGYLEVSGNYFNTSGAIIHFCGGNGYFDSRAKATNSVAKFNNNIVLDPTTTNPVVITPEQFVHTEINGNVFVDSKNLFKSVISVYADKAISPAGVDYAEHISVKDNRFIGVSDYLALNDGTTKLDASNKNYYAIYTADYSTVKNGGGAVYGVLDGNDHYLDFAASTLATDMDMALSFDGMSVNGPRDTASIIISQNGQSVPALKTNSGVDFTVYSDKTCKTAVSTLNGNTVYYAKATNGYGVSVLYTLYVSVGSADAPEYEGAYLLYEKCADMPVGTKFSATYMGTEYMFTAGVNAFSSLSQISVQNALDGGDDTIDVITLSGTYAGGQKVTGSFNIVGDNTVLKSDFVTSSPVKIACVGDSITEAVMDGARATWGYPARLNEFLDSSYGEGNYEVKNFGKGNSSLQQINTTTDSGLAANRTQYTQGSWYYSALDYNPDVVLVMIGHNDTMVSETDHIYKSASNYKKYYAQLIDSFKALPSSPQVIVVSCHSRYDAFRKNIIEKCIIPVQKELAKEYNTIFIDTYTSTDAIKNSPDGVYSSDNLHLTPKGYALLAQLIKDGMKDVFSDTRAVTKSGITINSSASVTAKTQLIKVAAIGDEVTYGSKSYVNYPMVMGDILGDGYEVRNYGECKTTVTSYLAGNSYGDISDYQSALAWKPDIAIMALGRNDASNTAFSSDYTKLINAFKAIGTRVYLCTSLESSVNTTIKQLGSSLGVTVIDVYTQVSSYSADCKQSTTLLTEKGNTQLGQYLTKQIFGVSAAAAASGSYQSAPLFKEYSYTFTPVTSAPLFTDRDDSALDIKNTAVAVTGLAQSKATGEQLITRWDGEYYTFIVGVNAFATLAEALATDAAQVIVPAGNITSFEVTRSVEIYGENHEVMPWVANGDRVSKNADWGKTGDSVISNTNIVIAASATPTDDSGTRIVISGFRFTMGVDDSARSKSNFKTSITLKNNILDRCVTNDATREFNFANANNKNFTDTSYTNIDELTIQNMFFINRGAHTDHVLFQEQLPSYFTLDGFGCNAYMATLGFPKWGVGTKTGKMTVKNCFVKDNSDRSSKFLPVIYLTGHSINCNIADEDIKNLDLSLEMSNNHFIDCYDGGTEGAAIIYPASFTDIVVDGNTFVSTNDLNLRAVHFTGHTAYRLNDDDFSERITFKNNRLIGYMAAEYVNDLTKIDHSENYFETYTLSYRGGVTGDIPGDTTANYYLDYACTTTIGDMAPTDAGDILGLKTDAKTRTVYGYAAGNISALELSGEGGVSYKVYSDAACTTAISSLSVTLGNATKAYVKAKRGDITVIFNLYVMGVKSGLDLYAPSINSSLFGIAAPTLWYPSLYGAPSGISVISYYDGVPVKFTTGLNVASSVGQMGLYGDDIIFPDNITEINGLELVTAVNIYSAVANIKGVTARKANIACVGDSITDGVIDGSRQYSYPTTMQNLLGTASFDIQNYGGSGSTAQYIEHLRLNFEAGNRERQYRVLRKSMYDASIAYQGDVVIIGLGANDSSITEPIRWLSNDNFINAYVDLIREYQSLPSKPAVYLTTTTPRYDDARATVLIKENMQQVERIIADMTGAKVIDLHNLMNYMFSADGTSYSSDKLHPTATGYQEMGSIIANQLTSTFTAVGGGTISINGKTVTGKIASSVANTKLAIKNSTIIADSAAVTSTNITSLTLHDVAINKGGAIQATADISNILSGAGSLSISLSTADTAKSYTATVGTTSVPVAVSTDDPVMLLKSVQAASPAVSGAACQGYEWARTVDADTLTSEKAQSAITILRTGTLHSIVKVAGKAPTDTEYGWKDYYRCEFCGLYFEDAAGAKQITDLDRWKAGDGVILYPMARNEATGEEYYYLEDALEAASDGDTVKLIGKSAAGYVIVTPGVTLDLNGYTLTADYVIGFNNSNVVDNSIAKTGRLVAEQGTVKLAKTNAQLPIYDSENGCYVFTTIQTDGRYDYEANGVARRYRFFPFLYEQGNITERELAHGILKEQFESSGVKLGVRLTYDVTDNYTAYQDYVFIPEYSTRYVTTSDEQYIIQNGNEVYGKLYVTFTQPLLEQGKNTAMYGFVQSETGVEIISAATTIQ